MGSGLVEMESIPGSVYLTYPLSWNIDYYGANGNGNVFEHINLHACISDIDCTPILDQTPGLVTIAPALTINDTVVDPKFSIGSTIASSSIRLVSGSWTLIFHAVVYE